MEKALVKEDMFDNRALRMLIITMIIENLLTVVTGMADTIMVSSVGEAAVSAVSLVDSLGLLFTNMFLSMTIGGAVVIAQYIGKHDFENAREGAKQLVYSATALSIIIAVLLLCFNTKILTLLYGRVEYEILENSRIYFMYIAISFPFCAILNSTCSIYRVMGKSKLSLAIVSGSNVANVIGNALLIYVFDMGVAGAAISTLFSRAAGAAVGVLLLYRKTDVVYFEKLFQVRFRFDMIKRILKIGVPNGIESSIFHIGKVSIQSLVSSFGTVVIAANAVANTVCNFGWSTIGAFTNVVLTVVGQCMGAGEVSQAERYTKRIIRIAFGAMIVVFGMIFVLGRPLALIFRLTPETTAEASRLIKLGAVLTCLSLHPCSFALLSSMRAAGDARYAVIITVFSMFTFRVLGSFALGDWLGFGITGVWIAMACDLLVRAICNLVRFKQGKWKSMKVI